MATNTTSPSRLPLDHYDIPSFYDGLVAHGLIIPNGVQGAFGRGAVFEDVVERFDKIVFDLAMADGAENMMFPPVIPRRLLEKVKYLESFPTLCGSIHSFVGGEDQAAELAHCAESGQPWGHHLVETDLVMTPTACYPVYPTFTGTLPEKGRLVTTKNWIFRHEPSPEPTRLQSFRQREVVRGGTMEQVVEWRDMWLQRGLDLLGSLGLPVESDVANDPFFGRGGRFLAIGQRAAKLKFELQVPVISMEKKTAVASFNVHQDHFAGMFDIKSADGTAGATACLGFGLERVTMALFRTHGFLVEDWPEPVRAILWK